jgi:hypothetical protein
VEFNFTLEGVEEEEEDLEEEEEDIEQDQDQQLFTV